MQEDEEDDRIYSVVVNHEEQYSIWLADRPQPSGWTRTGFEGSKEQCLAHIKDVWVDMRPLSLRKKIADWEKETAESVPEAIEEEPTSEVDDLVRRLSESQAVEASLRPERTIEELKAACLRGVVHVKFSRTGTELGVRLDRTRCDLRALDLGEGSIRLEGELALNYNRVRLRCTLDVRSFQGTGQLEFLAAFAPGEPWRAATASQVGQ